MWSSTSRIRRQRPRRGSWTIGFDGWGREAGSNHHLIAFTAAVLGWACFLDFWETKEDRCTAPYLLEQFDVVMKKHGL